MISNVQVEEFHEHASRQKARARKRQAKPSETSASYRNFNPHTKRTSSHTRVKSESRAIKLCPSANRDIAKCSYFRDMSSLRDVEMRSIFAVIAISSYVSFVGYAIAYDAYDPKNSNGIVWDDNKPLVIAGVTAVSRVHFIKSTYDDDFKAENCPNATEARRRRSHLVAADLVLIGRSLGPFTCASYQSPLAKKQVWENGWLPAADLTPAKPETQAVISDWLGFWRHPGGHVEIKRGEHGKLRIDAFMVVPTFRDFHNGSFSANVAPSNDRIDIPDGGDGCRVRIQRIQSWLMVEDSNGCGGAGVSFIGLYHRNK